LATCVIGAVNGVAIVVGEVRKDLKKNRRETTEKKYKNVELSGNGSEESAHANAGKRQRQRPQTKGRNPGFHFHTCANKPVIGVP
jgi:hypothetical protein